MSAIVGHFAHADELILEEGNNEDLFVGDFSFSQGSILPANKFEIRRGQKTVTAGQLWTYLKSQGIDSANRLTLCMDVDPANCEDDLGLKRLELSFQNPMDKSGNTYSLGKDSLLLRGYEVSSYRMEAKAQIDLGFDFMKVYTPDSTDVVYLDFEFDDKTGAPPSFFFASNDTDSSWSKWSVMLGLFAAFWILVFLILFRATKPPVSETPPPAPVTVSKPNEETNPTVASSNGASPLPERFVGKNGSGYRNVKTVG